MPGSVQNAVPVTVLPQSLCKAFAHERGYPVLQNEYANGECQRSVLATNSRKRWRVTKRLTSVALQTLRDFYDARNGPTEPIYFYEPNETSPRFTYDQTGQAATGRYIVRFDGAWSQSVEPGRTEVEIALVELA